MIAIIDMLKLCLELFGFLSLQFYTYKNHIISL